MCSRTAEARCSRFLALSFTAATGTSRGWSRRRGWHREIYRPALAPPFLCKLVHQRDGRRRPRAVREGGASVARALDREHDVERLLAFVPASRRTGTSRGGRALAFGVIGNSDIVPELPRTMARIGQAEFSHDRKRKPRRNLSIIDKLPRTEKRGRPKGHQFPTRDKTATGSGKPA